MRRILLLLISSILVAYAGTANKQPQTTQTKHKGIQMDKNLFGKEPIYKLRIRGRNAVVAVHLNGVGVYEDFTRKAFALITVNDSIIHGDNNISLTLSDINKLNPKSWGVVSLEVYYTKDGKQRHHTLSRLVYDLTLKEKTGDASKPGFYRFDDEKGMIEDNNGTLIIGKITTKPETMYRNEKQDGIKATQSVHIPAPYPRWRFLDSQDIIDTDYDYLSEDEYKKLKNSPKIQALYALDAKLRQALKAKNPQSIIDLFDERFEEEAAALYDTPQNLKKLLLDDFIEVVHNPNKKFIEYTGDNFYFVIEENRKLAWIKPIEYYNKRTGIYTTLEIKYRLNKQGEWVITR